VFFEHQNRRASPFIQTAELRLDNRVIAIRRFNDRQTLTRCQYQFSDMGDFASLFGAQEAA
jgi:hypothetical protein